MTNKHNRVECKCYHGDRVYQFRIEVADNSYTCIFICQDCYDRLKGGILQEMINEAVKYCIPLRIPQIRPD